MKEFPDRRRQGYLQDVSRIMSRQGWIALPLIILAAVCFLDQHVKGIHSTGPSALLLLGMSFPFGWFAAWAAAFVAQGSSALALWCVFVIGAVGTVVNIYFWVAFVMFCFKHLAKPPPPKSGEVAEAEFQRLLHEHRRENAKQNAQHESPLRASVSVTPGSDGGRLASPRLRRRSVS